MDTNPIPPNPPADVSSTSYTYSDLPKEGFIQKIRGSLGSNKLKLIPLLLLLVGLGAGLYLSGQKQETRSKASLPTVVFKDANGMDLPVGQSGNPQTTSPTIKIQLNSPLGAPAGSGVLAASTKDLFGVSVSGPTSGTPGQPLTYKASASSAKTISLFWMKSTDDPAKGSSWRKMGESNANACSGYYAVGKTACEVSGTFTPTETGSHYIVVNVTNDQLGPCSGSPLLDGKTNKNAQPLPGWSDCGSSDRLKVDVKSSSSQQLTASLSGPATATINQTVSYSVRGDGVATKSMDVFAAKDGSDLTKSGAWTRIGGAPGSACWPSYAVGLTYCTGDAKFTPKEAGTYYIAVNLVDDKLGSCSGNPSLPSGWKDCGPSDLITLTVAANGSTPTPPSQAPIRVTLTGPDRATAGATIRYVANAVISAANGSFDAASEAGIYVMKTDANLSDVQSIISIRSNESCGNGKQCVVNGEFPLTKPNPRQDAFVGEPGTYYVFAYARGSLGSQSLHCSGNPLADGKTDYTSGKVFPGTADCGPADRITLTVDPIAGAGSPTPPPTSGSPAPTGGGNVTSTTHYRIAETSIGLRDAVWKPYTSHPMVIDYTFSDQSPGPKQIWVEFQASNRNVSPSQSAVVELLSSATPTPTGAVSPTAGASPTLIPSPTGGLTPTPTPCPGGAKPVPSEPGGPPECPPL